MFHLLHAEPQESYDVAILIKRQGLDEDKLNQYYIEPSGLNKSNVISFSLRQADYRKRPTVTAMKEYLDELLPVLEELKVKVLYVTDGNWFKVLTKVGKIDPNYGYVLPCKYSHKLEDKTVKSYPDLKVILSCNHQALFMNDGLQSKIDLANKTLKDYINGSYQEIGTGIVKYEKLIKCNPKDVEEALNQLHQYDSITCDTETFSLRHTKAGLGTIGFAWNKNEGICIDVEHLFRTTGVGIKSNTSKVLQLIKDFFINYRGNIKYHNASYDIKILIYKLWMKHLTDTEGLLEGLEVLTRDYDCTKLISYLATNTCSGNKLSLKEQAHEFAGNYAVDDINDITLIPNQKLMHYNLIDCLSTWFVYEKNFPIMVQDSQEETYKFFKEILINIIQMELTGMPIDMERTKEVDTILKNIIEENWLILNNSKLMENFIAFRKEQIKDEKNANYVKKVITVDEVIYKFNPNSNKDLICLLHDFFKFEVFELTDGGQPAVGGDELKGHAERTSNQDIKDILNSIMKILEGDKIRNTFVSKFLEADECQDGWHYLFGSFNLGGTKSGRLSSSNP